MNATIHLNTLLIIGICMLPGSFFTFWLTALVFSWLEMGALILAEVVASITVLAGIALILLGIGMELH